VSGRAHQVSQTVRVLRARSALLLPMSLAPPPPPAPLQLHPLILKSGRAPHTEWQLPISGVHSIMMEKSAQPDKRGVGGAHPPPFTLVTITYKVVLYAPAEWADTLPLFHFYPLYVVCCASHPALCIYSQRVADPDPYGTEFI
jgi:hypothetical protein